MSDRPFVVENMDRYITDKIHYKKLESYMPDPCKHILIIGQNGRGKTNLRLNMLKYMFFEKMYVFAKDISEEKYELLKKMIERMEYDINTKLQSMSKKPSTPVTIGLFSNSLKDLPKVDDLDRKAQKIVIFDDFLNDKKANETIKDYFTMSRKKGVTCFYLAQDLFHVPKLIRTNVSYVIIFDNGSAREKQEIAKTYASKVPYYDFMDIYSNKMLKDDHAYMVIDLCAKRLHGFIRRSWDDYKTMENYQKMVQHRERLEKLNPKKRIAKIKYDYSDIDESESSE